MKKVKLAGHWFKVTTVKTPIDFLFGQMVLDFRVNHGLSPKKFCKLIGISEKMLNKIESN